MPSILHDVFCMYAHLLLWELQNYNSLLNSHWQENVGSYQGKIPHVQGQRKSPSKVVGGAKSCLESNPIPARDARRVQTNLVCTRTQRLHRDWARTVFECLLQKYRSAVACHRGRASGCRPLLTCIFAGDTQTQFWLSLCRVSRSRYTQGLFEPSENLWRVRGLILNSISPLLPSCLWQTPPL